MSKKTNHESDAGPGMLRTFTGNVINVFDPKPEDICIEDIAHALSNICRFNGHSKKFYSVAEHSIRCADEIESRNNRLAALMHDASEAYLCDIPAPIKRSLPQYHEWENKMMEVIAAKFGFQYPLCIEVKAIDTAMLLREWDELIVPESRTATLDPFEARAEFLAAFDRINIEIEKHNT